MNADQEPKANVWLFKPNEAILALQKTALSPYTGVCLQGTLSAFYFKN